MKTKINKRKKNLFNHYQLLFFRHWDHARDFRRFRTWL